MRRRATVYLVQEAEAECKVYCDMRVLVLILYIHNNNTEEWVGLGWIGFGDSVGEGCVLLIELPLCLSSYIWLSGD